MSLNKKKKGTGQAASQSTPQQNVTSTSAGTNLELVVDTTKEKLVSIVDTAKGALSNGSPSSAVPSITTPSPKGTALEKGVRTIISTSVKLIGGVALAAALVCVAAGVAQDYARKRRYKAGSGGFWTFLATVPSFKHPRPFFYKIASFANGRYVGDENSGEVYNRLCLIPAVKQNSTVHLLDDWGGWLSLYLDKGDGSELVISHDNGNQTIRVVTDDLDVVEYELPALSEVAPLLFHTEIL